MEDNQEEEEEIPEDNQKENQEEDQEEEPLPTWSWSEETSLIDDNSLSWDDGWNYQEAVPRSRG